MATHAKVTSVEALEAFRVALIIFLNKTHSGLDQVGDEIRRTRGWIQHEQRTHWEAETRRRARTLAQAEQELMSARMAKALDNLAAQQLAVNKARKSLDEAQAKMRKVKIWMRDFDGTVEPAAKGLNMLRSFLDHELPQGIAYLSEAQKIMEAYLDTPRPAAGRLPERAPALADAPPPMEEAV